MREDIVHVLPAFKSIPNLLSIYLQAKVDITHTQLVPLKSMAWPGSVEVLILKATMKIVVTVSIEEKDKPDCPVSPLKEHPEKLKEGTTKMLAFENYIEINCSRLGR